MASADILRSQHPASAGHDMQGPTVPPPATAGGGIQHGVEIHDQGWFHAESNRMEQEQLAIIHMQHICQAVDERQIAGLCPDGRWTNDPAVFPDLKLRGTVTSNGVNPFPPHDQQYFVRGNFDRETSKLRETAVPSHVLDDAGNSTWVRLHDFGDHADACHLFDESSPHSTHMGRVLQGTLDNGYLVEALQAISLRPKLARQLFYCWNSRRSVYVARLFKHGTWMRVEIDDYVPIGAPSRDGSDGNAPICCRSEHFPYVLWPSLIEKAYAKVHTLRCHHSDIMDEDRGGWEALSGGGRVEEALADLTGGVAGRFQTCDIAMDRLFLYIYELQRDTLFVCRPHERNCEMNGVRLNPYYPNIVNRACVFEGKPYVQMFSGAAGIYDGGLQDISVPFGLIHCEDYPETSAEGFFWISALDFHEYFDTIFECRLVNSGDVSIRGMPPPRMPPPMPPAGQALEMQGMPGAPPTGWGVPQGGGQRHTDAHGSEVPWFEWVFANPSEVGASNEPEFTVRVPDHAVPCEIVASVEQVDPRMTQQTPHRDEPVAILVKAYELVEGRNFFSNQMVCKSNWLPLRDSMIAFTVLRGGEFRLVAEFPDHKTMANRMIFRCYSSKPNVHVSAAAATVKHMLVLPREPPKAQKLTFVGCMRLDRVEHRDKPQYLNEDHDCLRKPEFDIDTGWSDLKEEIQRDCTLM
mmetsp:Transcript_32754/g.83133  ORF Transcript_32754/g.83133 Transcript_32754/m.83133 type:complete len:692 (-) Transcript_32754:130-2205(-)